MSTIITRIGYCPLCELCHNPRGGQLFLAHGTTTNRFKVIEADRNGVIGMTPHIYKLEKAIGSNVKILKSCAMYGCGVDRRWESEHWFYFVKEYQSELWRLQDWNALVLLKHNQFTKMYEI